MSSRRGYSSCFSQLCLCTAKLIITLNRGSKESRGKGHDIIFSRFLKFISLSFFLGFKSLRKMKFTRFSFYTWKKTWIWYITFLIWMKMEKEQDRKNLVFPTVGSDYDLVRFATSWCKRAYGRFALEIFGRTRPIYPAK